MAENVKIVVPWHNPAQLEAFLDAWKISKDDPRFHFQQDSRREGCGRTKNAGVAEAVKLDADIVIVLDDDCYPSGQYADEFIEAHLQSLKRQPVGIFQAVTCPSSRGTPYETTTIEMPVAASMGFWTEIGDYDAVSQLVYRGRPMRHFQDPIFGRYFPLCGMNLAFRPSEWLPWCQFIDVPRFDDIWMGWLWQKEAYRRCHCFALNGPLVRHVRQSNVWRNLREEAIWLERNETLWRDIALSQDTDYFKLRGLLPV